jgi:hypothetical protein
MGRIAEGDVLAELPRAACLVLMEDAELPFPDFVTDDLWAKLGQGLQDIARHVILVGCHFTPHETRVQNALITRRVMDIRLALC